MIEAFLKHHMLRAQDGLLTNALSNCHVQGLHSIMLHEEPGNRIRLFYASRDHMMHKNFLPHGKDMTLAAHAHHCEVRLVPIFGDVCNQTFLWEIREDGQYDECLYISGVSRESGGSLAPTGRKAWLDVWDSRILPREGILLAADTVHCIAIEEGEEAAWLVFESIEDKDYESYNYTKNQRFDSTGFYQPMPHMEIYNTLHRVFHRAGFHDTRLLESRLGRT